MTDSSITTKLDQFFSQFKSVTYKKGDLVISPEKDNGNIYYLKSGAVKMYALSEEGEELILQVFRHPAFFPFMIFLNESKNTHYFQAMDDVEAFAAPLGQVAEFVKTEQDILLDLATRFAQAIMGLTIRLEGMVFQGAYHKIVALFIYLIDKLGQPQSDGTRIPLLLNHQDIASWVGIRRETASRQLEQLKKNGLVVVKDQYFIIPDPEKLRTELKITA